MERWNNNYQHAERMAKLILLLSKQEMITLEIAEALDVNKRTVQRYLVILQKVFKSALVKEKFESRYYYRLNLK